MDCGFPLCVFEDAEVGELYRLGASLKFICHPAVDLAIDGMAWSCFPLTQHVKATYTAQTDLRELARGFARELNEERARTQAGIFEECEGCLQLEHGLCDGGCLAQLIRRSQSAEAEACAK